MKKEKTKTQGYVSNRELWMFSLGGFGQGMVYAMMSSYISDYYLNVLYLPAMFVLLLMLFARLWDAINDPLMGIIVDKANPKRGKMKSYILYAAVPIAALTVLMYFNPGLSGNSLIIYSAVIYVLWGMCYTMADVPFWSIPNIITPDPEERSHVISFSKIFNSVGSAFPEILFFVLSIFLPKIIPLEIEGKPNQTYYEAKYLIIAVAAVVIGMTFYVNSYFHIKEKVTIPVKKREPGQPSTLKRVFTCKPLLCVIGMGVLSSGRYMVQAAAIHVARYSFYIGPDLSTLTGDDRAAAIEASIGSVKTIFQVCAIVGMFGSTLLMPFLMKKFDYKKLLITTCLGGFVASIFTTLIGWFTMNLYICIPFIVISCIPLGVINTISIAMICDCLDYMEVKNGFRDNALGTACQGFINKLGSALSSCGIVVMYMAINLDPAKMYDTNMVLAATQMPTSVRFAMFSLVSIVPGVSLLLCAIPMFFYEISGSKKKEIQAKLAEIKKADS